MYSRKLLQTGKNEFRLINDKGDPYYSIKKSNDYFLSNEFNAGHFQPFLKCEMVIGDCWKAFYSKNELDCLSEFVVKDVAMNKIVDDQQYMNVVWIQESKFICLNGGAMPLNFYIHYFFADDIGLIFQSSSSGETHTLIRTLNKH